MRYAVSIWYLPILENKTIINEVRWEDWRMDGWMGGWMHHDGEENGRDGRYHLLIPTFDIPTNFSPPTANQPYSTISILPQSQSQQVPTYLGESQMNEYMAYIHTHIGRQQLHSVSQESGERGFFFCYFYRAKTSIWQAEAF